MCHVMPSCCYQLYLDLLSCSVDCVCFCHLLKTQRLYLCPIEAEGITRIRPAAHPPRHTLIATQCTTRDVTIVVKKLLKIKNLAMLASQQEQLVIKHYKWLYTATGYSTVGLYYKSIQRGYIATGNACSTVLRT